MPTVDIAQVTIGRNRRPIKPEKIAELMESIKASGLLNPITLDGNLNLIAGLHRLTACKLLGLEHIECSIVNYKNAEHARLAEIDENLIRSELDALERDELWLERDLILERLGLRARKGDNQHTLPTKPGSDLRTPPPKTTLELALEVGYNERTFQRGKQIARSIAPEVKEVIKGTPIAKSTTALLKIANAGSFEREQAEKAEKAAQEASARLEQEKAKRQTLLAAEARARQKDLQLTALQSVLAERESKEAVKKAQCQVQQQEVKKPTASRTAWQDVQRIKPGDQWLLERHLVYCGDTSSKEFIDCLPSNAALAIAAPSPTWNHDYLVDEARIVAVLREEDYIHELCQRHQMPFRFQLIFGELYVAIFSDQKISKPQKPIGILGVEGIVAYLVSLYTQSSNFVIAPFLGRGEVLMACERMGRICFAGEANPELVNSTLREWQRWTGKQTPVNYAAPKLN